MRREKPQPSPIWDGIEPRRVESWDGFQAIPDSGYYFRGHASPDFRLESSIERFFKKWGVRKPDRRKAEMYLIRDFRRGLHRYVRDTPAESDDLEWLAAMQHYGTPTRLLDFTYSKYVAAFFAARDALKQPGADGDCEMWGIRITWALGSARRRLNAWKGGIGTRLTATFNVQADGPTYREVLFKRRPPPMVLPATSFRTNERLSIQLGVFLCPLDVSKSFEENLSEMPEWDHHLNIVRYRISRDIVRELIRRLHTMNISDATLFPGLDGYARTLSLYQWHVDRLVQGKYVPKIRKGQVPW